MSNQPTQVYEFGPFRLDPAWPRLMRDGEVVALTPKALEILATLIRHSGEVVAKEILMKEIWPDTFVEDGNLSVHIFALRKALGETANGQSYIETVPRRGYRFTAYVNEIASNGADLVIARYSRSQVTIEEQETTTTAEKVGPLPEQRALTGSVATFRGWSFLKKALVISPVLPIAIFVFFYFRAPRSSEKPSPVASIHSIAVLPFKSLDAEIADEHVGLGMADALITKLGSLRQISVRPTSVVMKYATANQDPQAIGRALGVDAVLAGSLQREGERVRATVQLIDVRDGALLWATKFDDRQTDILNVQDSISEHVVKALSLNLSASENKRFTKRYTENSAAYLAYLKGRYFWNKRTAADAEKAIRHFEEAIALDPNYALAYSGLADCYAIRTGIPPKVAIPRAMAAALKALELDSDLAEGHVSLATIKELYEWDRAGAEWEYKRAIELNPDYAFAHGLYSMYLTSMGRFEEGAAEALRAQQLDPLSPSLHIYAGWNFYNARRYDESIEQAEKAIDLDQNVSMAYNILARAYAEKKMYKEAIESGERATTISRQVTSSLSKEHPLALASLGYAYAVSEQPRAARRILEELKQLSTQSYISPNHFAVIYAGLGENEQALEYLEKTFEERDEMQRFVKVSPIFDRLHSEPRFADLMRRVGLSQK